MADLSLSMNSEENDTTRLLDQFNTLFYLGGLKGFWIKDVALPKGFLSIFNKIDYVISAMYVYFPITIIGSFFTQKDLTEQQCSDRLIFGIMLPGNWTFYAILLYYRPQIKDLLYHLAVVLKKHHNDAALEREMIRKIRMFSVSLSILVVIIAGFYGVVGVYRVTTSDDNFITIIPTWPDVNDPSRPAGVMRVILYICWCIYVFRILATFLLIVTMIVTLCNQFKNLQSYFYSLDDIFNDMSLTQTEKELKYEHAFKIGIQMHAMTLWCKKQHEHICKGIFAIEVMLFFVMMTSQIITLLGTKLNMTQLVIMFIITIATMIACGFFMWNGGDITVEAAKLSDAMYSSGWQNCYGKSSARIRKLVVNAMRQAQEPVIYKTLGVVKFSYETYVSMVKMPYTVVSVFY